MAAAAAAAADNVSNYRSARPSAIDHVFASLFSQLPTHVCHTHTHASIITKCVAHTRIETYAKLFAPSELAITPNSALARVDERKTT